jgi:hypothetical protein
METTTESRLQKSSARILKPKANYQGAQEVLEGFDEEFGATVGKIVGSRDTLLLLEDDEPRLNDLPSTETQYSDGENSISSVMVEGFRCALVKGPVTALFIPTLVRPTQKMTLEWEGWALTLERVGEHVVIRGQFDEEKAEEFLADQDFKEWIGGMVGYKLQPADRGSSGEKLVVFEPDETLYPRH